MGVVSKHKLANEVSDILELPRAHGTKAYKIVTAIIQTMINALQRGEEVKIFNFGYFKIVKRSARGYCHFNGPPVILPAKKVVRFKPSRNLRKELNAHNNT